MSAETDEIRAMLERSIDVEVTPVPNETTATTEAERDRELMQLREENAVLEDRCRELRRRLADAEAKLARVRIELEE